MLSSNYIALNKIDTTIDRIAHSRRRFAMRQQFSKTHCTIEIISTNWRIGGFHIGVHCHTLDVTTWSLQNKISINALRWH